MAKNFFTGFKVSTMLMFNDYKAYKSFVPHYSDWKSARDLAEAKRVEYLKRNPSEINSADIQKAETLLRAIDVMDEYSQKRAEDMETASEQVVSGGMSIAMYLGGAIGSVIGYKSKAFQKFCLKFLKKEQQQKLIKDSKDLKALSTAAMGIITGVLASCVSAFPLFAWASKAEVKASRKGRFEAMTNDLNDPKTFAVLTPEQEAELNTALSKMPLKKDGKNPVKSIKEYFKTIKGGISDSSEFLMYQMEYERKLNEDAELFDTKLTEEEIENAKRDRQILTKLVEKIDIASQDYAENAELATGAALAGVLGFGALFNVGYNKLAQKFKWKSSVLPSMLSMIAMFGISIFAAAIQKEAARVGRFKIKQDLLKHPEQLAYVSDEKTENITDVNVPDYKKPGIFPFLKGAWKDKKEYERWKKKEGAREKNISKALQNIELSDKQLKDAKRIQHNTFKVFNKVDENSQKYSESIEALGQALQQPVALLCSFIGITLGAKYLKRGIKSNKSVDAFSGFMTYMSLVLASVVPAIGVNAYITKEQKKASRVADMLAINELSDYRHFADYSRVKNS